MTTFLMISGWLVAAVACVVNAWLIKISVRKWLEVKRLKHLLELKEGESAFWFNRAEREWPEVINETEIH